MLCQQWHIACYKVRGIFGIDRFVKHDMLIQINTNKVVGCSAGYTFMRVGVYHRKQLVSSGDAGKMENYLDINMNE